MQINLFSSQTFQVIKQTVNRYLTPQQQIICAIAALALSCLAAAYSLFRSPFKAVMMVYDPEFEKGLTSWIVHEKGNATIAANRIRKAYLLKENYLELDSLGLKSLPPEIGKLVNLTNFFLYRNNLENLPESMGNLVNLTHLYLSHNQFKSLPESMDNLVNLTYLSLSHNQFENLPESITNLPNLTHLNLSHNEFENLSESLGNLLKLRVLYLTQNPIHSLPILLGQCSELTYIDCLETQIPWEQKNAILAMCQALRAKEAIKILPTRLKTWQTFSEEIFKLDFIENLIEEEKQTINEWLTRLERTHDFNIPSHQKTLAKSVCRMLESLEKSPSFKEIFFIQVPPNLVACGDRAAMSFNELGLAWTCDHLSHSTLSEKEKLNILIQAAKTEALHQALQKCIEAQEKKTAAKIEEGVEIYLYYETHLKGKLNLLTFMSDMLYSDIGKRDWIEEKILIQEVNKNYQEHLLDLPTLLLLCKADAKFNADWQKIEESLYEEMEKIHPADMKEGEYTVQMDKLKKSFENQKRSLMLDWVKSKF